MPEKNVSVDTDLMHDFVFLIQKAVACTSCIPSTNRYAILESREMRRFFLEHLVRVGDQRDVRCKKCEAASIAYVQIGPCKYTLRLMFRLVHVS